MDLRGNEGRVVVLFFFGGASGAGLTKGYYCLQIQCETRVESAGVADVGRSQGFLS